MESAEQQIIAEQERIHKKAMAKKMNPLENSGAEMRQFRGKTKDGKWVEGNYAYDSNRNKHWIVPSDFEKDFVEVIPSSVGQDTGLKDSKDKAIYEGDIVQPYAYRKTKDFYGIVIFDKGAFRIKGEGLYQDTPILHNFICRSRMANNQPEVIGKATDNPELLEKK